MEQSCRLCANTEQRLTSIANYRVSAVELAATVTLDHLIEQYLAISVNPSTYDPLICVNCLKRIEEWHAFRESCQQHNRLLQEKIITLDHGIKNEFKYELYVADYGTTSTEASNDRKVTQLEEDFEEEGLQLASETESLNHVPNVSPCPTTKPRRDDLSGVVSRRKRQGQVKDKVIKNELKCELYVINYGTRSDEASNDKEVTQLEEDFEEEGLQLVSETESSNHVPNVSPCPEKKLKQDDLSGVVSRRKRQEVHKLLACKKKRGRPIKIKETPERLNAKKLDQPARKQRPIPKICSICGVARTDMVAHMRWHNNERPYQCPHCPKIFLNSSNLKNHINLHTREKMYKCDLCDKEFPSTTGRSKHRETHTTERSHLCAVCGKSFKYRASLARHKLIHFEEPKEKCSVCDMLFLTKTRLTKHFLVHMDVKPFCCDVCGRAFNRKDNLKTHKKTHITGRRSEKKREKEEELVKDDQTSP